MIAIERRAFPTPWSLAMFVLELSKPSGICLVALDEGRVAGYLVCSRYDIVWHVMNVAVDPGAAPQGHRAPHCSRSSSGAATSRASSTRSRCASRTRPAIALYEKFGFVSARACGRATTTTTRKTP